jgi:amidophosphoribosyltransferase
LIDSPREACGVFGLYGHIDDVARTIFFGLTALQHRGQESAGIATMDNGKIHLQTGMGLVSQAFIESDLRKLPGTIGIGHTRYSTTGSSESRNAQPFVAQGPNGTIALAHNGNVINALSLRQQLITDYGSQFLTTTDSEVILQFLLSIPGLSWADRIGQLMREFQGAYSVVFLCDDGLIAIRDPLGVRPLCLGSVQDGWVVASESCALDQIGAEIIREVEPGEAILINNNGLQTIYNGNKGKRATCSFEFIYFARPDSIIDDNLVYSKRMAMGRQLAIEQSVDADLVIPVPDSAIPAGVGYASESGIPYQDGLIKNRNVGRTFIQPDQRMREQGVRMKFNPLVDVLYGKRIIVVDDSIVRGNTTPHVISLLRKAGAKEIHWRVASPPIVSPCHFGVDMATQDELIAANRSVSEINEIIGADSLGYLSIKGMLNALGSEGMHCTGCFTREYPIPIQLGMDKYLFEKNTK